MQLATTDVMRISEFHLGLRFPLVHINIHFPPRICGAIPASSFVLSTYAIEHTLHFRPSWTRFVGEELGLLTCRLLILAASGARTVSGIPFFSSKSRARGH